MSQVVSQTSSRCVADKPQTCRQGEGASFVRHFHPVYSVRSFQMTQWCLRQPPTSIHIEKNHPRSSKRARKHRRQTGRVELNSTFPVSRRQPPMTTVYLRQTFTYAREYRQKQRRPCRRHVAGMSATYVN